MHYLYYALHLSCITYIMRCALSITCICCPIVYIQLHYVTTGKRHSVDSLNLCDTFDTTKKRPYSIISLATSSSSNSSSGSTGPGSSSRRSHPWLDLKATIIGW